MGPSRAIQAKRIQAEALQMAAQATARAELSLSELSRLQPGDVRPPEQIPGERHAEDIGAGLDPQSQQRLLEAGEVGTMGLGAAALLPLAPGIARGAARSALGKAAGAAGAGGIGAAFYNRLTGGKDDTR